MHGEDVSWEIEFLKEQDCLPENYDRPRKRRKSIGAENTDSADELELFRKKQLPGRTPEHFVLNTTTSLKECFRVPPLSNDGLPLNWTRNTSRHAVFTLVELKKGEPEFDQIEADLVAAGIKVESVERLQNKMLLDRFKAEISDVQQHRATGFDVNLVYLYHGTNADKDRLCEEGLDQRLSRMGHYGKGIYFSDTPAKCVQYTSDSVETASLPYILRCRVLLGDTKVYPDGTYDSTLRREPEKEHPTSGWRYYDSVMGCPMDHNEYVVYENRRAMIEYIITFSATRDKSAPGKTVSVKKPYSYEDTQAGCSDEEHQETSSHRSHKVSRRRSLEKRYPDIDYSDEEHCETTSKTSQVVRRQSLEKYCPQIDSSDEEHYETSHSRNTVRRSSLDRCDPDLYTPEHETERHSNAKEQSGRKTDLDLLMMIEKLHCDDSGPVFGEVEAADSDENTNFGEGRSANIPGSNPALDISEFLQATGVEDSHVARKYLQRADGDVNLAITYYYEDL